MRPLITISMLLVLSSVLIAQDVHADLNPAAEGEIKALELKMDDLIVQGNWDEYMKHLASDYLHTRADGRVEGKDEALTALRGDRDEGKRKIIFMEMEPADLAIHIYGDTAISSAEFTVTARQSGQVKTHLIRETDVFVKRGQWILVARQDTMIGK
ncbi:MAG: nuclear transport factor 2 family protein [Terriglobales bacterium]